MHASRTLRRSERYAAERRELKASGGDHVGRTGRAARWPAWSTLATQGKVSKPPTCFPSVRVKETNAELSVAGSLRCHAPAITAEATDKLALRRMISVLALTPTVLRTCPHCELYALASVIRPECVVTSTTRWTHRSDSSSSNSS